MNTRTRFVLICLLALAMLLPAAFAEEPALTLSSLPAPHLDTALRLDAALNAQFDTLATAVETAEALARARQLHAGAEDALAQAEAEEAAAQAVADAALAAVAEQRDLLAQLAQMRALYKNMQDADAAYALAMAREQEADAALDLALEEAVSAQGLLEETIADLQDKHAELEELTEQLNALTEKIKDPEAQDVDVLKADLASGQQALSVLQEQRGQLQDEVEICTLKARQAEEAQALAEAAQMEAINALEQAAGAADLAKKEWSTVQLSMEEIDQAEAEAKTALLKAEAELAQAEAALSDAQAFALDKLARLQEAASALEQAEDLDDQAAAAKAALELRWAAYADIPGMVTDAERMPAMDVVAAADADTPVYVIHAYGQSLYFFLGGELQETQRRRERDVLVDVSLTVAQTGKVALRYIHESGKTRLESLASGATVLFTGGYDILRLSDMLGPNAVYLGAACQVKTLEIPPVLTVVHLTQEEPIRHLSQGRLAK